MLFFLINFLFLLLNSIDHLVRSICHDFIIIKFNNFRLWLLFLMRQRLSWLCHMTVSSSPSKNFVVLHLQGGLLLPIRFSTIRFCSRCNHCMMRHWVPKVRNNLAMASASVCTLYSSWFETCGSYKH